MLEFYSGSSNHVDSRKAVKESLALALGEIPLNECKLLIIYSTIGHNFEYLLLEAGNLVPNAQIVGCTGSGIIGLEGPNESMKAIAIMAVIGDENEFTVTGFPNSECSNTYNVGARLASELKAQNPNINLILLHPSLISSLPLYAIVEGVESVLGKDIPIIGAAASDNMKFYSDYEFVNGKVLEKGTLAIGFSDPTLELICAASQDVNTVGSPMSVTKSEGGIVYEIDGKLPWEAYTEKLGLDSSAEIMDVAFSPLAVKTKVLLKDIYNNECYLPGLFPHPDGFLISNSPIPEDTLLWITKRNEDKMFQGVDNMMKKVINDINGREIVAILHADCAIRGRWSLNVVDKTEIIHNLQAPLMQNGNVPWLGLYCGGEYLHLGSENVVHTYSSSLSILVRK